ncbi:hypothetical protein J4558_23930 [Leptolyngbya sp. 15MV]|nr:hypothetical protein J4558_23930 [Leptolyngbya sp. 15MV]
MLLGWFSVQEVLLLFWAENVVIGLFQLGRMATVLVLRQAFELLVTMPFFIVHYGGFAAGHAMILLNLFGLRDAESAWGAVALLLAPGGLLVPLLALVASHGFSFVVNFLGGGEWRAATPRQLMSEPYARVVILHAVLIAGGGLVVIMGAPVMAVALLVVVKIGVDVVAHRRRHRAAAIPPRPAPAP